MTRRTWTRPELVAIAQAVEDGQTWDQAARPYGVSGHTARTLVRRHGIPCDLGKRPTPEHRRADLVLRAIALRNTEGTSWALTAARVGWPRTPQALRVAAVRYCARHGGSVRAGYPDVRVPR